MESYTINILAPDISYKFLEIYLKRANFKFNLRDRLPLFEFDDSDGLLKWGIANKFYFYIEVNFVEHYDIEEFSEERLKKAIFSQQVFEFREFLKFPLKGDYSEINNSFRYAQNKRAITVSCREDFYKEYNKKAVSGSFVARLCHIWDRDPVDISYWLKKYHAPFESTNYYPLLKRQLIILNNYLASRGFRKVTAVLSPFNYYANEQLEMDKDREECGYGSEYESAGFEEMRSMDDESDGFWQIENDFG